jgi:uncharacterized membrane protein YphA (DoxX/SURF4 family)
MLVRRLARPMFAAWFAVEGWEAVRHPAPHVDRLRTTWADLAARVDLPPVPSDQQLRTAVRVHGAATAAAAAALALGRAPRTAALVLAALTAPLLLVDQPVRPAAAGHHVPGRPDRAAVERFARSVSMLGGALLVGLDHEGRPGIAWRIEHAAKEGQRTVRR